MEQKKLLPCPNCWGREPHLHEIRHDYVGGYYPVWFVKCSRCGFSTHHYVFPFEAEDTWNRIDRKNKIEDHTYSVLTPEQKRRIDEVIKPDLDALENYLKELSGGELIMEHNNEYKVEGNHEITNGERKVGEVIHQAMLRCFSGKGKERHNVEGTVDFMDQPLMEISRRTGIGGPLYQVHKKAYEAHDMVRKGDFERARNELLDIIIYTAATVLLLDEQKEDK